ncbi:hypothetical protein AAFF_G00165940, partial [Aldrovandia affinis]
PSRSTTHTLRPWGQAVEAPTPQRARGASRGSESGRTTTLTSEESSCGTITFGLQSLVLTRPWSRKSCCLMGRQ